jgi:hypothetical protein
MMSQCSEYQNKIARSLLGDLNAAEQRELEQHLATCPHCRSEQAEYAEILGELKLAGDEPIPRHFFVHPLEEDVSFWKLFLHMKPRRQFLALTTAVLFLFLGIAALSRLQVQVDRSGFRLNFGANSIDVAALKNEILEAAEARSREGRAALIQEMRSEIARSGSDLSRKQHVELVKALMAADARFDRRLAQSEDNLRNDSQKMIAGLYQTVSQQRARDLDLINLRFASAQADDALKTQQTDEILDTLLQEAELRLR